MNLSVSPVCICRHHRHSRGLRSEREGCILILRLISQVFPVMAEFIVIIPKRLILLSLLSFALSTEARPNVTALFTRADANGDRKVSPSEIRDLSENAGENGTEIRRIIFCFVTYDQDGDEVLDNQEFEAWFGSPEPDLECDIENLDGNAYDTHYFKAIDQDRSGYIDKEEFRNYLERGYPAGAQEVIEKSFIDFDKFDSNGDLLWNQSEFVAWEESDSTEEEDREDFQSIDTNQDGFLTVEELRDDWIRIGSKEIADVQDLLIVDWEWDIDGDGVISFEEWIAE